MVGGSDAPGEGLVAAGPGAREYVRDGRQAAVLPPAACPRGLTVAAIAGAVAIGAGPAAYSAANLGHSLNGNNVLAGPSSVSQVSGFGGGGPMMRGAPPSSSSSSGHAMPSGGGMGGGLSSDVVSYLLKHQGSAKYLVAASGSQTTSSAIIDTGKAVVTIGGFSGRDNAPTVAQLAEIVASGELKYVLVSDGGAGGGPGGGTSSALTSWVKSHGTAVTAVTVSGGTLYRVSA